MDVVDPMVSRTVDGVFSLSITSSKLESSEKEAFSVVTWLLKLKSED